MTTNEETNFVTGNDQTKNEKKVVNQNENGWQSVTIGGVTGILMGAGAMYVAEAFATKPISGGEDPSQKEEVASSHVATNGLKVAEVDQNLSFGQAFEAARNAIGPGGVFHWHGNIYNTYRLEEWNAMSASDRAHFAQQVQPEIQPGEGRIRNHHEVAYNDGKSEEPLNHKSEDDNKSKPDGTEKPDGPEKTEPEKPFDPNNPDPDTPNPPDDGEIHVLGYTNVEIEGQEHFAGHLYDGDHIYLIDIDKDDNHEYDIAISDNNKDGKLTMNESIDISEYHYTRERLFIDAVLEGTSNQVATNTQDDISPETPDYVNDANTTI